MAGPVRHPRLSCGGFLKTWAPGTSPGMTNSDALHEHGMTIQPKAKSSHASVSLAAVVPSPGALFASVGFVWHFSAVSACTGGRIINASWRQAIATNHELFRQLHIRVVIGRFLLSPSLVGLRLRFSLPVRDRSDNDLGFRSRDPRRRLAPRLRAITRPSPRTIPCGWTARHGNVASSARHTATRTRDSGCDESNESEEHHGSKPRKVWLPMNYPICMMTLKGTCLFLSMP